MNIEKWVCNKCGSPCKVEIHFDSKGPAGDAQRFRGRCLAGTKDIPEDHTPEWRRQDTKAPIVVCLCGSTRFFKEFMLANYRETMAGRIVLSVGFYPHSSEEAHGEHIGITADDKVRLDDLHKRKIDLADEILVLNVGGYIGESTRSEIKYANTHSKRIRYLEPQQA